MHKIAPPKEQRTGDTDRASSTRARLRDRSDAAHEILVAVGPAEPRMVLMAVAVVVFVVVVVVVAVVSFAPWIVLRLQEV